MWQITLESSAVKDLKKLPPSIRTRIIQKLRWFAEQDDPIHFAVQLIGNSSVGEYRFRVSDYRIIFDKNGESLIIRMIEHRRDVYKG